MVLIPKVKISPIMVVLKKLIELILNMPHGQDLALKTGIKLNSDCPVWRNTMSVNCSGSVRLMFGVKNHGRKVWNYAFSPVLILRHASAFVVHSLICPSSHPITTVLSAVLWIQYKNAPFGKRKIINFFFSIITRHHLLSPHENKIT